MAYEAPVLIDSGRVIGRGFGALGRNILPFLGAALLLTGLPTFFIQYASVSASVSGQEAGPESWLFWASMLAPWLLGALLQGILVRATVFDLAGQGADIVRSSATALGLFLPIFAISLLTGLGLVIGLILLVVPGVMFYIMMIVAVPALIEERAGIFGSMRRSYRLTKGNWLQIFVLVILYALLAAVILTILGLALGVRNFGIGDNDPLMAAAASGLGSTATAMIGGAMIASLYIELRSVKEGATTDDLASIFA